MKKRIFYVVGILGFGLVLHIIISICDVALEIGATGKVQADYTFGGKSLPMSEIAVGIHMVNSPEKLHKNYSKFKHFEIDSFFINDDFYIAHDKQDLGDLTLCDMLHMTNPNESYIWLDLKNQEMEDNKMVARLEQILEETGFTKEHILVEATPEIIKALSAAGFYTAFTPNFDKKMTIAQREALVEQVKNTIMTTGAAALEGNVAQYPFLRDAFPEMDKVIHFARPFVKIRKQLFIKKLSEDPKVKFVVVEDN